MTNPAYVKWVLMKKGSEQKMVHPGNVGNHVRFGWTPVEQPQAEPEVVAVETPAGEPAPAKEPIVIAEPEPVVEDQNESTTEAARKALTPKASSKKKAK